MYPAIHFVAVEPFKAEGDNRRHIASENPGVPEGGVHGWKSSGLMSTKMRFLRFLQREGFEAYQIFGGVGSKGTLTHITPKRLS